MSLVCSHLKADKAKACNPGFETVNGGDKLLISGQGRVLFQYIRAFQANINAFNIVKDKDAPELIMNGFYNGQAQGTGLTTMRLLPLSRWVILSASKQLSFLLLSVLPTVALNC